VDFGKWMKIYTAG